MTTQPMNPEVKAKWLAALRSGEYEQTRGILNNGAGGYCCLGVLCEVHAKETDESWNKTGRSGLEYHGSDTYLPYIVQEWAGLGQQSPSIILPDARMKDLADLNDYESKSFAEIADLIEAHL